MFSVAETVFVCLSILFTSFSVCGSTFLGRVHMENEQESMRFFKNYLQWTYSILCSYLVMNGFGNCVIRLLINSCLDEWLKDK